MLEVNANKTVRFVFQIYYIKYFGVCKPFKRVSIQLDLRISCSRSESVYAMLKSQVLTAATTTAAAVDKNTKSLYCNQILKVNSL